MNFVFNADAFRVIVGPQGTFRLSINTHLPEGYTVLQEPPISDWYWGIERWEFYMATLKDKVDETIPTMERASEKWIASLEFCDCNGDNQCGCRGCPCEDVTAKCPNDHGEGATTAKYLRDAYVEIDSLKAELLVYMNASTNDVMKDYQIKKDRVMQFISMNRPISAIKLYRELFGSPTIPAAKAMIQAWCDAAALDNLRDRIAVEKLLATQEALTKEGMDEVYHAGATDD